MAYTMEAAAETAQHLTFRLAGEEYALELAGVKEIIQWQEVTQVPGAPATVRGVLNLRGVVVPVVDLAVRFGRAPTEPGPRTCIVIVETRRGDAPGLTLTGLVVDGVSQVVELGADDVQPPPSFGTGVRTDFLRGLARIGERFTLVLDLVGVLSTAEIIEIASVEALLREQAEAAADDDAPGDAGDPD